MNLLVATLQLNYQVLSDYRGKAKLNDFSEVLIRALMSKFELSTYFLLGGGRSDMKGFIGCLKNVKIQESTLTMDSKGTVKFFCHFWYSNHSLS